MGERESAPTVFSAVTMAVFLGSHHPLFILGLGGGGGALGLATDPALISRTSRRSWWFNPSSKQAAFCNGYSTLPDIDLTSQPTSFTGGAGA